MNTGGWNTGPILSVALRDGSSAELWADRIVLGGQAYSLGDITWAGFTGDANAPAVGLALRDGRRIAMTPADPPDAQRFLDVLYLHRPDLRMPPPPPQGAPGGAWGTPTPPPPYGYPGYGYQAGMYPPPPRSNSNETVLAGIAHLSIFFGGLIVPLIIWLVTRESSPYASRQGKQAFFFHLGLVLVSFVVFALWFVVFIAFGLAAANSDSTGAGLAGASFAGVFLIWGVFFVVYIGAIVLGVIGAVQAFQGKPFHYPLLGRL
ncbi:MAG TPA: DUF4870 domain-containing protein [Ktedonobacterales bacterium]|jgi:hypothetical protein|nr:DUF4870 domain-containing protein [Ktedonobacterales bacterium]